MSIPPEKRRVVAYIDGYDLYHGIRDAGWRRYLWLDLSVLSHALLIESQQLIVNKYFTIRVSAP